jgi:hypothetical protein
VQITVVTLFEMSVRGRAVCSQLDDFIRRNARLRNGVFNNNNNNNNIYLTAIGLRPGGSGQFTCTQL